MKKLITMLMATGLLTLLTLGGVTYADSSDINNGHNVLIYHTNGHDGFKLIKADEHAKKLVYGKDQDKDKDNKDKNVAIGEDDVATVKDEKDDKDGKKEEGEKTLESLLGVPTASIHAAAPQPTVTAVPMSARLTLTPDIQP